MAEGMSFFDRYKDDILTDNTNLNKCEQCKDCIFNNDGTVWSNVYTKGCCEIYPYPEFKPVDVMNDERECEFRETEDDL